jgi:hypothetical protein
MPVAIQSFVTSEPDTGAAVADLRRQLDEWGHAPDLLFVFYDGAYSDTVLYHGLRDTVPRAALIGGNSGQGVMSGAGVAADQSIGLLAISDPDGNYGVASASLGADPATSAEYALHAALRAADAEGELPELVWIYQAPGQEEAVLAGLRRVVGDRCPIIGGSSVSVSAQGQPRQFGTNGPLSDGLVVGALFPSGGVTVSYQSGFEPTGASGIVTSLGAEDGQPQANGAEMPGQTAATGRTILTIDGESAVDVYDRWMGGTLPPEAKAHGGAIALDSAWYPLGDIAGDIDDLTYFRLVHIGSVTAEGGLRTYAAVSEGSRVYAMRGSRTSLIHRAGRVATTAISALEDEGNRPAGALMVYCIGCRLAVGDEIADVADRAREGFQRAPFVGCFTAGEQGPVLVQNVHANLMISAVVFGR